MSLEMKIRSHSAFASPSDEQALEAVLAAVEPTRLKILFLLGSRGRLCVGDIASGFKISRPAVSHHLKVLKSSGLVQTEREGQEIYYSVRVSRIVDTLRALADSLEHCCSPRKSR
jgi:ArsR family transcriptional regulator, arsenate/arsenite/antimonite-responsive transcriptional repressor